ncbi:MAG: T9SS type A sorting domain-containing protein [Candidatus Kryptoniota bacterium]
MRITYRFFLVIAFIVLSANLSTAQWEQVNGLPGTVVESIAVSGAKIFVSTEAGIFASTDYGTNWSTAAILPSSGGFGGLLAINGMCLIALSEWIYLSTDNGASWTKKTAPPIGTDAETAICSSGSNLFVGTMYDGVFISSDSGATWKACGAAPSGIFAGDVTAFALSDSNFFVATSGLGVFLSTDNGKTWAQRDTGLTDVRVHCLALSGKNLFAGTQLGGVYLSTDNGATWLPRDSELTNTTVSSLIAISDTNVFASTPSAIFVSTNSGTSWSPDTYMGVSVYAVCGTNLFAGGNGLWRKSISEMLTNVRNDRDQNIPYSFGIEQNYPNPFNPSTTIVYQLPRNTFVTLEVFDVLGRRVQTLVSQPQTAGIRSAVFNATDLPSGMYFCRLEAGTYHDTKKMLLLK